jgi:hypothetical protein
MATYTVNWTIDNPPDAHIGYSLREALASADANPGPDTIEFSAADFANQKTIVLYAAYGQLTVASDVTVDGGDLGITIDANGASRVLRVQEGADVTLDGLTLTGGRVTDEDFDDNGGGIFTEFGTSLTLLRSSVTGNAMEAGGGEGGGIFANGDLVLRDSAVTGNLTNLTSNSEGGGIVAEGNLTLTNSTVADNRATSASGISSNGDVSITDSTLTGNYARTHGVVLSVDGSLTIANSVMVGNDSSGYSDIFSSYGYGLTDSNGHNLFGTDVKGTIPGDLENIAAQSVFAATAPIAGTGVAGGVLAANGGPTETVALLDAATNPALGRGEGIASITTDQRGEPRPAPGDTDPDIGAFELQQSHDTAVGTEDGERLEGDREGQALLGLGGGDRLHGRAGGDLLDGGPGPDRLHAGRGGDVLIGGADAERFVFGAAAHSKPGDPDTILDFSREEGDRIGLRRLDADPDRCGDQELEFIDRDAFTDAGQVRQASVAGHTVVKVNLDHDLHAELVIQLNDAIDLHRGDFLL